MMTRKKMATENSRTPPRTASGGDHRPKRSDPQEVEPGVRLPLTGVAPTGKQAYGDKGGQHRGTRTVEVEPQREWKIITLPEPVGEGRADERRSHH